MDTCVSGERIFEIDCAYFGRRFDCRGFNEQIGRAVCGVRVDCAVVMVALCVCVREKVCVSMYIQYVYMYMNIYVNI